MKMRYKKRNYSAKKNSLKCTCCGNYYEAWWTPDQASHCASYFYINNSNEYAIYGSYPSSFDDIRFVIINPEIVQSRHVLGLNNRENTKNKYGHYNDSKIVVCDFCLKSYLEKRYIIEDVSYDPYAVVNELNSFYRQDPFLYMQIMNSGPSECIRLIKEEKEKSTEQREIEKKQRDEKIANRSVEVLDEF